MKTYIGIDNGVTGTIGIIGEETIFVKTPIKKEQDYTKAKKVVTRLDITALEALLVPYKGKEVHILMERPLVNPKLFNASTSALRCFEAELVCVESMGFPHEFIDSKEWQKELLPKGCQGEELKTASLDIGNRLFPKFKEVKHPDRDGILIAEYARRKNL